MKRVHGKTVLAGLAVALGLAVGFTPATAQAQHFHNNLTHASPISQTQRPGRHFAIHRVFLHAGAHYHINLNSQDFDTYLIVINPFGQREAENDDGPNGLNSALTFFPQQSGVYEIMVTTFGADATGHYHLDVERHFDNPFPPSPY